MTLLGFVNAYAGASPALTVVSFCACAQARVSCERIELYWSGVVQLREFELTALWKRCEALGKAMRGLKPISTGRGVFCIRTSGFEHLGVMVLTRTHVCRRQEALLR